MGMKTRSVSDRQSPPPSRLRLPLAPHANQRLRIVHPPSVRIGANDNALEKIFREFLRSQAEAARIGSGPTAQFDNPNGPDAAEYSPNKRRKILVADEARTIYPPFQVEQHMWATRA